MHQTPHDPQYVTPRRATSPLMIFLMVIGGCVVLGMVLVAVLTAMLYPVSGQARLTAQRSVCASNQKQLAMALLMYTQDYNDRLPIASTWQTATVPYIKNARVYACPSARGATAGYAFNSLLDQRPFSTLEAPQTTPMLYDTLLTVPNVAEPVQSFATRHGREGNVAFADGHVQSLPTAPAATPALKEAAGQPKQGPNGRP